MREEKENAKRRANKNAACSSCGCFVYPQACCRVPTWSLRSKQTRGKRRRKKSRSNAFCCDGLDCVGLSYCCETVAAVALAVHIRNVCSFQSGLRRQDARGADDVSGCVGFQLLCLDHARPNPLADKECSDVPPPTVASRIETRIFPSAMSVNVVAHNVHQWAHQGLSTIEAFPTVLTCHPFCALILFFSLFIFLFREGTASLS